MEKRGDINQYDIDIDPRIMGRAPEARSCPQSVFTINLATGVTPFCMRFFGHLYESRSYKLARLLGVLTVSHGWYRPRKEEFDRMDQEMRNHVLNGGLECGLLAEAVAAQIENDPVDADWSYEKFQQWCLTTYGVRLKPESSKETVDGEDEHRPGV